MASTPTGTVVQVAYNQLKYTDTGSYGTVSSRTLVIYSSTGTVLDTVNMGATLTYTYTLTADAALQFVCTVVDNISGSPWVTTVYTLATGFFWQSYAEQYSVNNCGSAYNNNNLTYANNTLQAAIRFTIAANLVAAQRNIVIANYFANAGINVQYQGV